MAKYTQELHQISVETPLGKDKLYLKSFQGEEEISRLFQYALELFSDEPWIDPKSIVGKNTTVTLNYPDGKKRFFNGVVSRFAYLGTGDRYSGYRAEMVPALWFLTRTADCRIFQDKKIPDILEEVFSLHGFSDYKLSLAKSYPQREYCVQYRETAFNFVSRLMEEYGIFYFFEHQDGKHTMVLGDDASAYQDCLENEATFRRDIAGHFDMIAAWEHRFEYRPGKWAHTDYNFETPKTDLNAQTTSVVNLEGNDKYEIFDFPGKYAKKDEGEAAVRVRMEEDEVPYDVVIGSSYCRSFTPGGKFKVKEHISGAETGKSYVITSVRHAATASEYATGGEPVDSTYENAFYCVPDSVVARPARTTPKPAIHGSQTAVVVGPPGEEIWPDKYGRVKVQFFWDRYGQKDDKSSCWIRCAQASAGRNWGFMSIPRIGQEVLVSYLEGDPDRPLITGQVYNADQMPPYGLPDEKTKTCLKSNSSKGGDGHNELRFEDKADEEQVYVHAERNMDVFIEKKETRLVGPDGQHLLVQGDSRQKIEGKLSETINQDHHEKVQMNYALESGLGLHIKGGMTVVIEAGVQLTLKVGGSFVDISPLGVCIQGPLVNINSGGAPGSGSGSSPDDPEVEEEPDSTSGSKSSD